MTLLGPPSIPAELNPPEHDRTTTLAALAREAEGPTRVAQLFIEAALFTGIGVLMALALGIEQPGVISIFLAAGALGSRAKEILRTAEEDDSHRAPAELLALFAGVTLAYSALTLWLGADGTRDAFAFALDAAHAGTDDLLHRHFPAMWPLFGHNLAVLGTVVVLSVVYRSYGALLALAWNASVWGVVLTSLVLRSSLEGGGWPLLVVGLGLLPHLALEALAYVVAALAGARLGRALTRRSAFDAPIRPFGAAVATLLLASLIESTVPPTLSSWAAQASRTDLPTRVEATEPWAS